MISAFSIQHPVAARCAAGWAGVTPANEPLNLLGLTRNDRRHGEHENEAPPRKGRQEVDLHIANAPQLGV